MRELKVAMLGFGNAGRAFAGLVINKREEIKKTYDCDVKVVAITTGSRGSLVNEAGIDLQKALQNIEELNREETIYSIINYRQGIIVIYTIKENSVIELESRLMCFLEESGLKKCLKEVGISGAAKGLENLGHAVQECLCANTSCLLDHSESIRFCDSGLDQILLPMADSFWLKKYYTCFLSKITGYDSRHGAKLMETLLEYAESNGDMKLTAIKMFQHSNTIRYRIDKIRKLLELENDASFQAQLCIFARLHRIYENSENDN